MLRCPDVHTLGLQLIHCTDLVEVDPVVPLHLPAISQGLNRLSKRSKVGGILEDDTVVTSAVEADALFDVFEGGDEDIGGLGRIVELADGGLEIEKAVKSSNVVGI